ncbi:MAG: hypothetical protein Aurels2KO_37130 [Aureliella sp.]
MKKPWEQPSTIAWVESVIQSHGSDSQIPHDRIAQQLLVDEQPSAFISDLARELKKPREWIADNMVAYFSKELASNTDNLASRFRRFRFGGKWAYLYEGRE